MDFKIIELVSRATSISTKQVGSCIKLLEDGATIPFISRYRKEATGSLDEVAVGQIKDSQEKFVELIKRKETIINTIDEQGKLNPELRGQIDSCWNTKELEDIYLPYKPKRKTKASIAIENGLEPLAKIIMAQHEENVEKRAEQFLNDSVECKEDALQGARDIIAEWINEKSYIRNKPIVQSKGLLW